MLKGKIDFPYFKINFIAIHVHIFREHTLFIILKISMFNLDNLQLVPITFTLFRYFIFPPLTT